LAGYGACAGGVDQPDHAVKRNFVPTSKLLPSRSESMLAGSGRGELPDVRQPGRRDPGRRGNLGRPPSAPYNSEGCFLIRVGTLRTSPELTSTIDRRSSPR